VADNCARYLARKRFIDLHEAHYSLALLSLAYLAFPQVDKQRSEDDIRSDLVNGIHPFYDYASACWAMHLQESMSELKSGDKLDHLRETLEAFVDLHWSQTHKPLQDLKRVHKSLSSLQASEMYEKITQAVGWAKKQSGQYGQGPSHDDALELWQTTEKIRLVLEHMQPPSVSEADFQKLQQLYGTNWFKCSRVNCLYYHQGFTTVDQRNHHVDKHDRPFLCSVAGCPMEYFGYATEGELKNHVFKYHGLDMIVDNTDDVEFPDSPREKTSNIAKGSRKYQCNLCPKIFTRNHNLKAHMRTHEGTKPYGCSICGERFTRKPDCDRHERGHGDKNFICTGPLSDGTTWGCKASFGRIDKFADHLKTKTGKRCIRPLLLEKLKEGGANEIMGDTNMFADQVGDNADALVAAGKSLPSFEKFLQLCGLDQSVASPSSEVTSPSENLNKAQN
jgi:hypothetical protein